MSRKRPKIEKVEEEALTQNQLQLNNQLKIVLEDRIQLQQKLQAVEGQREKYQKLIYGIEDFVNKKKGIKIGQGESFLVTKLKNQINDLNNKIEIKEETIEDLKKNPHHTKKQETQILIEYLNYFSIKLRKHIQDQQSIIISDNISLSDDNNDLVSGLAVEIQELTVNYQQMQDQNENLQIQKQIWDKKVSQQYLVLDKKKQDLKEKEKDLYFLRNEIKKIEEAQKQHDQSKLNTKQPKDQIKKKLDPQNNNFIDMDDKKTEIIEKEQAILQQEKIINELKEKLQERTNFEIKSKNQLHDEVNELKEHVSQMKQNFQELKDYYYNEIQPLETENIPIIQGNKDHMFTILHDILQKQEKKYIKASKVKFEAVEDLGKEISMRLQLRQIPLEEACQLLIGDQNGQKKFQSIQELQYILAKDPFQISDPQQGLLIARFMVEDNCSDVVNIDPELTQRVPVVKSVFRQLTGCYTLMDSTKDKKLWEEISAYVVKFELGIKKQFETLPQAKTGFIQTKDLFTLFTNLFIELTEQQKEYMLFRLFAYTNNIHKIMHMKLFDIFKTGAWIERFSNNKKKI